MKKLVTILFVIAGFSGLKAQDESLFSQYINTQGILNPAYTGTRDNLSGLLLYRNQWLGFEGAPKTMALNAHMPVASKNIGLGITVIQDELGLKKSTEASLAFSYRLKVNDDIQLSLGLNAGINTFRYNSLEAIVLTSNDFVFNQSEYFAQPNFGFGAYLYSERYFAGFSLPRLFSTALNDDRDNFKTEFDYREIHSYFYGGYVFDLNSWLQFKPTFLARSVFGAPIEADISANFLLHEFLWLGCAYRTVSDLIIMADVQINPMFSIGYSYDYATTRLNKFSNGSHEICLKFDYSFSKKSKEDEFGIRSIRYF